MQLNGAAPAPTYEDPVEVTLSATDGTGGTGVEWTEYRVDGGAWTRNENTGNADPLVTEFTVGADGEHTVEYRSRDRSGNTQDPPGSVTFTIEPEGGGGSSCLPQSDEFDGTALDGKWDVLRENATSGPTVNGGSLGLPILQGDFIANDPLASNTLLQDAPTGEWTVTAKLDTSAIDANGEQAGLVIWKSENPNTFSKLVAIQAGNGNHQFEHIVTQNGSVNPPIPQSITPAPGGQLPDQVLLRARYDGTNVIGEFSPDDGETWTLDRHETHAAPLQAPLRVGLAAFRGSNGGGTATFDWFRVHEGAEPGGPVICTGTCFTRSDSFDGALNTARWSFRHSTTPATGARAPRAENGSLVLPLGSSAIDVDRTGPIAFLGQPLPEGDFTVEAKINAPGLDADDSGEESPYAQVGLGLYQTDGDWIGAYQTRNGDSEEPGTAGGTYFEVKSENGNARTLWPRVGQAPGRHEPAGLLDEGHPHRRHDHRGVQPRRSRRRRHVGRPAGQPERRRDLRGGRRAGLRRRARRQRHGLGDVRVHPVHAGRRLPGPVPPAVRPVRRQRARPEVGAREPERDQPAERRGRAPEAPARPRRPVSAAPATRR